MRRVFYVYVLFRQHGEPFYVGMGQGERWLVHQRKAHFLRSHRDRVIVSVISALGDLPKVKVGEGLTRDEAVAMEIALIAAIGREPAGPLINQTRGGDGAADLPEETKRSIGRKVSAKIRGRRQAPEHTEKIRAAHVAMRKVITPEQRDAIRASLSGRKRPDLSAARRGKPLSETAKAKLRARVVPDEVRLKISAGLRGRPCGAETAAKISAALRGRKKSAAHISNLAAAVGNNTRGKIWITDGAKSRRVAPIDVIPDGWRLGRALSKTVG